MSHYHYIWLVVLITSSFVSATRNVKQLQEYRNLSTCENENCVNNLSLSLIPFEDWQSYFLSRNETTGSVETLCRESLGQNWQSRERRFKVSKQPGSGHREHNWSATDGKCKMVLRPEFRHIKRFSMKDFHYQVLSQGSSPLTHLESHMKKFADCVIQPYSEGYEYIIRSLSDETVMDEVAKKPHKPFRDKPYQEHFDWILV